jgi:hypothetical protein
VTPEELEEFVSASGVDFAARRVQKDGFVRFHGETANQRSLNPGFSARDATFHAHFVFKAGSSRDENVEDRSSLHSRPLTFHSRNELG